MRSSGSPSINNVNYIMQGNVRNAAGYVSLNSNAVTGCNILTYNCRRSAGGPGMQPDDFQDALGLQHEVEAFEKLRLGLVQAYVQERVRFLRCLPVVGVHELATTEGGHFVQ